MQYQRYYPVETIMIEKMLIWVTLLEVRLHQGRGYVGYEAPHLSQIWRYEIRIAAAEYHIMICVICIPEGMRRSPSPRGMG
jgi:sRNA-binding carbon storage regulator CsrA